jgi:hypothetical protein
MDASGARAAPTFPLLLHMQLRPAPAFVAVVAVLLFAPTTRKLDPSAKARNPADTPPLGSERPQTFNDQLTLHRINVLIARSEFRKATLHPAQE